ncbi:MAG: hypothetical protein MUF87_19465 [Anaerolineae bacterium]|nr:hypothetical protein [Anaerolineae bacterium]
MQIAAQVVDIRRDQPRSSDQFFVDTNVWYWVAYTQASQGISFDPRYNQISNYTNYLDEALKVNATLYKTALSFAELTHSIEKTQCDIFINQQGLPPLTLKKYRYQYPMEQQKVFAEVEVAWTLITAMSKTLDLKVDDALVEASLSRLNTQPLDGYDLFMLELLTQNGISAVISDDRDFALVPNITLFTAHDKVIQAAKSEGKLLVR